jgi:hypothetical protein
MKRIFPFLICILLGVGIGWYFGYIRPSAENQREILRQYEFVRDGFQMTNQEMAEAGPKIPRFFEDMKRQDELAAIFALGGFRYLDRGDIEGAKTHLLKAVGSYYRVYHNKGGDTNLIAKIEEAALKHPAIAKEISKKIE